jgi:hypothetical protein
MARAQYDNTVHDDEYHYNNKIAAGHADRAALVAAAAHYRQDIKRTIALAEMSYTGAERRALDVERRRLEGEVRRCEAAIKEHDEEAA